jgi:hypothetical protein
MKETPSLAEKIKSIRDFRATLDDRDKEIFDSMTKGKSIHESWQVMNLLKSQQEYLDSLGF